MMLNQTMNVAVFAGETRRRSGQDNMTVHNISDYRKPPPPEDQEVRAEVLLARIAWLEEVIENQWKQITTLRKLKRGETK